VLHLARSIHMSQLFLHVAIGRFSTSMISLVAGTIFSNFSILFQIILLFLLSSFSKLSYFISINFNFYSQPQFSLRIISLVSSFLLSSFANLKSKNDKDWGGLGKLKKFKIFTISINFLFEEQIDNVSLLN
jgi:hypothetical protein